jgi:hypothetical protein
VGLQSHALATLEYIRASMDSAAGYAVPGLTGIVMGGVGLSAAIAGMFATSFAQIIAVWLVAAFIAFACGSLVMIRQGAGAVRLWSQGSLRKFVLCLAPCLAAGAVMTAVLWLEGAGRLLPGTWLLLYGAAVLAASTTTARSVAFMGGIFVLLGLVAFIAPISWANSLLGLGFGGLHLGFGLYLTRTGTGVRRDV